MPIWDDFANYVEANNTLKNTLMIGVVCVCVCVCAAN